MEKVLELYKKYRDYILFLILFVIFSLVQALVFWYFSNDINELSEKLREEPKTSLVKEETKEELVVDIKGEVKKPGVYILDKGKRVIDVVKKAGGFTVYADTSANNLSMKITDEMVIVIYSESEIRNYLATLEKEEKVLEKCQNDVIVNNSCKNSSDSSNNKSGEKKADSKSSSSGKSSSSNDKEGKLVSLNTATLEELMTLSGVGESKAKAIIEYRETKKFETIEEIKEVSGIGDALFEKIKDSITT